MKRLYIDLSSMPPADAFPIGLPVTPETSDVPRATAFRKPKTCRPNKLLTRLCVGMPMASPVGPEPDDASDDPVSY